ncbi:MAG: hypothetical protein ACR2FV_01300 [Ornithinimicrobium sp.]|uniref:hypothetical protein n=1 Tax=Ornithinimicrobium sp. TaxID=1977084 RepID=UPI003D9BBD81
MTSTTPHAAVSMDHLLVLPFPEPGPALRTAYREIAQAVHGTEDQKKALGDPHQLPRPWDPATCRTKVLREQLWDWLDRVVTWLNHEYVWDPAGTIPPCWPRHPHLVHELAVLADHRRRAGRVLSSDAIEEWHRYNLPAFTERMRTRLQDHCTDGHQPWPARSRHVAHTGQQHTAHRAKAFNTDTETMQQLLDEGSRPLGLRLHALRVDPDTVEVLD